MASLVYNVGSYQLQHRDVDWLADTIEVVIMKSTYTPDKDDTNGVLAAGELATLTGYAGGFGGAGRKVLASKTLTNDTANDRTVYDAADPSAWTINAGDTVGGFLVQKKGSANDTTAVPLFFLDVTDTPTNGAALTLQFAATGIGYTQQ
jgi:TctA family transporter